MADTTESLIEELDSLLDRERGVLLEGALEEIGPLMEEKATLIARMTESESYDPGTIRPLQLKLRRNQELFDQSLEGIRNVASRLNDLRQIRKSMDVYDAQGKRESIGDKAESRLERRA